MERPINWPRKFDIFGVKVSATTYDEVTDVLIASALRRRPTMVDFTPVSVLVDAARNATFRDRLNAFDVVCPDGQPVRWCLNYFHNAGLADTVCGTATTLSLCEAAARHGVGIYLYGSTTQTLQLLQTNLQSRFPRLRIVGAESPPFRRLRPDERDAAVHRINRSGAGLVFVGLGSPRQELFVWEQRSRINAVQLCVGAAFDFIAGTKKRAPRWMQNCGLEWIHRFCSEPARLGRRYVLGNSMFVGLLVPSLVRCGTRRVMATLFGAPPPHGT